MIPDLSDQVNHSDELVHCQMRSLWQKPTPIQYRRVAGLRSDQVVLSPTADGIRSAIHIQLSADALSAFRQFTAGVQYAVARQPQSISVLNRLAIPERSHGNA